MRKVTRNYQLTDAEKHWVEEIVVTKAGRDLNAVAAAFARIEKERIEAKERMKKAKYYRNKMEKKIEEYALR